MDPVSQLRVADLETFICVCRLQSVTAAAREIGVTPSQVSRSIARLERLYAAELLRRGAREVVPTDRGVALVQAFASVLDTLRGCASNSGETHARELAIAAPSYLAHAFVPAVVEALPALRLRALEMSPTAMRARAGDGLFQVAIMIGSADLHSTVWDVTEVGPLRLALMATPAMAERLGPPPVPVEAVRSCVFVVPTSKDGPADDGCPIPVAFRSRGHEAETLALGLEVAARSDQLVFGPVLAARRLLEAGRLVEVAVEGWSVTEQVSVACHELTVRASDKAALIEVLRDAISA